jgi:hypothetical protein
MNINKLENDIMKLAEALDDMHNRAVVAYTPIVDDICNRDASEKEVDNLLTWMFDFVGHECMLLLFKKVCRKYFYTYPEVVGFYILEYRKVYDEESLRGTEYDNLLEDF